MKNVLFVGDNPFSGVGNGNMMAATLSQVDTEKYNPVCLCSGFTPFVGISAFSHFPLNIFDSGVPGSNTGDAVLHQRLWEFVCTQDVHAIVFVGLDIWKYAPMFQHLDQVRRAKKVKLIAIFPYDLQDVRKDWVRWIKFFDGRFVYSQYGYNLLQNHVENLFYYRPPLYNAELFVPAVDKMAVRKEMFPTLSDENVLVGFVGNNQIRKNPEGHIRAFALAKKEAPYLRLYLHTELEGIYNLKQCMKDCGLKEGDVLAKTPGVKMPTEQLVKLYQSFDMLVNCTIQEGLSWTPLEAILCGTPVVYSETTALPELIGKAGVAVQATVPCEVPLLTESGRSFLPAMKCSDEEIADGIIRGLRRRNSTYWDRECIKKGQEYLTSVCDINKNCLDVVFECEQATCVDSLRKDAFLFAQHSSAGDVLMTTQCFKGLKERHKGLRFIYMTQSKYAGIVKGNPYVDEVIDWDPEQLRKFSVVYNPHGERILPAGFNSLETPLYEMYPYFTKVKTDKMLIAEEPLPVEIATKLPNVFYIVQSAGQDKTYRTYKHMSLVLKMLKDCFFVQVGDTVDEAIEGALDLRGKFTYGQSAALFRKASGAILIDSFPAHLAGCVNLPSVVLFGPAPARVTRPRSDGDVITCLEPNKLDVCQRMTACFGKGLELGCSSPCINTINPMQVVMAFKKQVGLK